MGPLYPFPTFAGVTLELASIMKVYLEPTLSVKG